MGACEMKVDLVAWSQGIPEQKVECDENDEINLIRPGVRPTEVVGRAAGICWNKEDKEDYDAFVRRVIKTGHESVIEHASFTFRVEGISRALTHQWVRHRLCSFSQRSQRYVKEREPSFVMPKLDYMGNSPKRVTAVIKITAAMDIAWEAYNQLIELGVKGEDARFVLPNACETKMVWTANARELRHFFKLRMDKHAQWEIRAMAKKMFDLVMEVAPALFEDLKPLRDGE